MEQISLYLPGLILAYSAFFLGIASPGPNVLAILGTSIASGRRAGLALAMGVATGSFIWAVVAATGLSVILTGFAGVLVFIKIAGGCYLLWLAFKAFRSCARSDDPALSHAEVRDASSVRYYTHGLVVQMTNPKAVLAWVAIMSLGVMDGAPLWVPAAIVIGTSVLSILIHALYAMAFSSPPMVLLYKKTRRGIQGMLGVFFTFAGLRLILSRTG
ncbi:MAG: LysE family transporter [Pseudomonadota bacterium]